MKAIFVSNADENQAQRRRPRTEEELQVLRQSLISGAYVVQPRLVAEALLAEVWLSEMRISGRGS